MIIHIPPPEPVVGGSYTSPCGTTATITEVTPTHVTYLLNGLRHVTMERAIFRTHSRAILSHGATYQEP